MRFGFRINSKSTCLFIFGRGNLRWALPLKWKWPQLFHPPCPLPKPVLYHANGHCLQHLKGQMHYIFDFFSMAYNKTRHAFIYLSLLSSSSQDKKNLFLVPLKGQFLNILRRDRVISITGLLPQIPWKVFCLPGWVCHSCSSVIHHQGLIFFFFSCKWNHVYWKQHIFEKKKLIEMQLE